MEQLENTCISDKENKPLNHKTDDLISENNDNQYKSAKKEKTSKLTDYYMSSYKKSHLKETNFETIKSTINTKYDNNNDKERITVNKFFLSAQKSDNSDDDEKIKSKSKSNKSKNDKLINQNNEELKEKENKENDFSDIDLLLNEDDNLVSKKRILKNLTKINEEKQEKLKNKRIKKRMMNNIFFENEADLGSENEEHDDIKKNARDLEHDEYLEEIKEEKMENENMFLKDLVDENFDEEYDSTKKYRDDKLLNEKFIEDELRADKEMIKKIINFDHNKRKNKLIDEGVISEDDEDYIPLEERMEKDENADDILNGISDQGFKFQLLSHLNKAKKSKSENLNRKINTDNNGEGTNILSSENEEIKEMNSLRQEHCVKKFAEKYPIYEEQFKNRMKENKTIFESNVINVNDFSNEKDSASAERGYLDNQNSAFYKSNNLLRSGGLFYSKTNSMMYKQQSQRSGKISSNNTISFSENFLGMKKQQSSNTTFSNSMLIEKSNSTSFNNVNNIFNNNSSNVTKSSINNIGFKSFVINEKTTDSATNSINVTKSSISTNINKLTMDKNNNNLSNLWISSKISNAINNDINKGALLSSTKKQNLFGGRYNDETAKINLSSSFNK